MTFWSSIRAIFAPRRTREREPDIDAVRNVRSSEDVGHLDKEQSPSGLNSAMKSPPSRRKPIRPLAGAHCPYCGVEIKPPPARKRKCPSCKQPVFVKYTPTDPVRSLLTKEQADEVEAMWNAKYENEQAASQMESMGASHADVRATKKDLAVRFGRAPSSNDVAWGIANKKYMQAARRDDFQTMSDIRFAMAQQVFDEGKDPWQLLRDAGRDKLRAHEKTCRELGRSMGVRIQVADSCEHCRRWAGKKLTIEQALTTLPVPEKACSTWVERESPRTRSGWCRCSYELDWPE